MNEKCKHEWDEETDEQGVITGLGICRKCGLKCEHENFTDGFCDVCGFQCDHEEHEGGPAISPRIYKISCLNCGEVYLCGDCDCSMVRYRRSRNGNMFYKCPSCETKLKVGWSEYVVRSPPEEEHLEEELIEDSEE